jgi:hypothetical protein
MAHQREPPDGSPAQTPPETEPVPEPPRAERGGGVSARAAFGYSTLAVGVGFLAGAVVEAANWVSDSNASTTDRQSVPASVTDVCSAQGNAAALDACNKSSDATKASALGWVFGGVGAGLVVTGLWLVLTDHPSRSSASHETGATARPRLDLLPSFGPGAGAVRVRLTF